MTWRYRQSTGELSKDGVILARGYSGAGDSKNRPECQGEVCRGPIPAGDWIIAAVFDSATKGPWCLRLVPAPTTQVFGRAGFLVHGDSKSFPGTASEGCIILPRWAREAIWASSDHALEVVT